MREMLLSPLTLAWAVLLAATALSLALTDRVDASGGLPAAGLAIIAIAFFKVRLVGLHFMELATAPWPLRLAFETWVLGVSGALMILTFSGEG